MLMNRYALAAALSLKWLKERYTYLDLDEWTVMPNHVHAIILIDNPDAGAVREPPLEFLHFALIFSPGPGEKGAATAPQRGSFVSAPASGARWAVRETAPTEVRRGK